MEKGAEYPWGFGSISMPSRSRWRRLVRGPSHYAMSAIGGQHVIATERGEHVAVAAVVIGLVAVSFRAAGRPLASTSELTLVVRPPRERAVQL